ncbi:uncharacterized protein JCM6883_000092 [Sporobolomyces salmoneus]|uniref:uncharacterized protein n=1 Tax=Sporobolomyces salmoneus TaxID=183962 RepID=UPI003171A20F
MRLTALGTLLAASTTLTRGHPTEQVVLSSPIQFSAEDLASDVVSSWPLSTQVDDDTTGEGHLSQWSRQTKEDFLEDLRNNNASDWVVVMGNEAGDLDSLVSALALAYAFTHTETPQKAIALLQTEQDALDLRPENALSLHYSRMSSGHRDLLTIDELPIKPNEMSHRIKGIALVDHNVPRSIWDNATVVAIIDHHDDRGIANGTANPRIVEATGSCSSLVARWLFDNVPGADKRKPGEGNVTNHLHGPLPEELVELLLRTIAIDTGGMGRKSSTPIDLEASERLFPRSSWKHRELKQVMKVLDDDLSASRKALDDLDLRSLLRRDWKGDSIKTKSEKYPSLSLGFASAPVSLEEQIMRTPEQTPPEWFAIERAWTSEIQADVTVALTNFRHPKTKRKTRQIAVIVAHGYGKRLHEGAANRLFHQLQHAIENADIAGELKKWKRPDGKKLLPRRAVYEYEAKGASRKFWRSKLEQVAMDWTG